MRCAIGPKKVAKMRRETGLPIAYAMTRGNTGHRVDLCLEDGTTRSMYPDGSIEMGWPENCTPMTFEEAYRNWDKETGTRRVK